MKLHSLYYRSFWSNEFIFLYHFIGIFRYLSESQLGFIAPDTSPRDVGILGESDSWDFGVGAGFYLDATNSPWNTNWRMYSYLTNELPSLLAANFPTLDISRMGVTGHSMGGHGALTLALKNQDMFKSVSAFSPICNPTNCPWGKKAFTNYLGADQREWEQYDATELIKLGKSRFDNILIDIGTSDSFLSAGQLLPEAFSAAAVASGQKIDLRMQEGYDHSYYFVSTFIEDHVKFHKCRLV